MWFVIARLILTFTVFGYAGYRDFKARLVDNQIWRDFTLLSCILFAVSLVFYGGVFDWVLFLVGVGLTAVVSFGLFFAGLFGGADSKALLCLSLALPFGGERLFMPLMGVSLFSRLCFPLVVLWNGVLVAGGFYACYLVGLKVFCRVSFRSKVKNVNALGVPFLVFLFVGLVVALVFGDLVWLIISFA